MYKNRQYTYNHASMLLTFWIIVFTRFSDIDLSWPLLTFEQVEIYILYHAWSSLKLYILSYCDSTKFWDFFWPQNNFWHRQS